MMDAPLPADLCDAWRRYLANDSSRPAGLDVYDDIFADGRLFPLQRKRELAAMMRLARAGSPRVVCEVGADKGGGFYHWLKCLPSVKRAVAIEIRGVPYADLFRFAFPDVDFLFIGNGSRDDSTLRQVRDFLGGDRFDCAFLDGDKSAFDADFDAYAPMVRRGGLVFLHDINDEIPPARVFSILKGTHHWGEIIDISEGRAAMERARNGVPVDSAYEGWLRTWGTRSCGVGCIRL